MAMKTMRWFYVPLLLGLLVAVLGASPMRNHGDDGDYAARRLALAEQTFKELVELCGGSDQLNLASDYVACERAIEGRKDLRAAMLENILFDYCNVPDSLKTEENREAFELCDMSYFTLREKEAWNELGVRYIEKRLELDRSRENIPKTE